MLLKIAANHSFSDEEMEILKPHIGQQITLDRLVKIGVTVMISPQDPDDGLVIDHPYSVT